MNNIDIKNFIICGGGRKNITLIKKIGQYMRNEKLVINDIDNFKFNGDFIESQAFAYLAVKSFLNLPISFPNTTRSTKPSLGGQINKNF